MLLSVKDAISVDRRLAMGTLNRAFRNVWRKKARTMLVLALLGISLATILAVFSTVEGSKDNTEKMIQEYEDTLNQVMEESESDLLSVSVSARGKFTTTSDASSISEEERIEVESLDEVDLAIPTLIRPMGDFEELFKDFDPNRVPGSGSHSPESLKDRMAGLGGGGGFQDLIDYTLNGFPIEVDKVLEMELIPIDMTTGRSLSPSDRNSMIISEDLVEFFDAGVGEYVEIEDVLMKIVGTFSGEFESKMVYTPLAAAQEIMDLSSDSYPSLTVYAVNESVVDGLVVVLEDYFPTYNVISNKDINARRVSNLQTTTEQQVISLQADMEEVESTGTMIIGISMVMAGVIVFFIMQYTVKERTKEIGTLKAIGFTRESIMGQILLEGLILSMIAGVAGVIVGWLGAPIIADLLLPSADATSTGNISPFMILLGLLIMIGLGSLGSIYPAFIASRKSPVEAMRHE